MVVRDDKPYDQVMTLGEMQTMKATSSGRLHNKRITAGEAGAAGPASKRPGKDHPPGARGRQRVQVPDGYRGADISGVVPLSAIFAGRNFCIINGSAHSTKNDLEMKVQTHGGTFTQNPIAGESCFVIAGHCEVRTKNLIARGTYDVIKAAWLETCLDAVTFQPFITKDLWYATPATKMLLAELNDDYGDSYMEDTTTADLTALLYPSSGAHAEFPSRNATPQKNLFMDPRFPSLSALSASATLVLEAQLSEAARALSTVRSCVVLLVMLIDSPWFLFPSLFFFSLYCRIENGQLQAVASKSMLDLPCSRPQVMMCDHLYCSVMQTVNFIHPQRRRWPYQCEDCRIKMNLSRTLGKSVACSFSSMGHWW